jgi:hypothetical protein
MLTNLTEELKNIQLGRAYGFEEMQLEDITHYKSYLNKKIDRSTYDVHLWKYNDLLLAVVKCKEPYIEVCYDVEELIVAGVTWVDCLKRNGEFN